MTTQISRLHEDLARSLRERLRRSDVALAVDLAPVDVAIRFFDYVRRAVRARPRQVYRSDELNQRTFADSERAGLECIISAIARAEPLGPFYSRQWLDLEGNDPLFNDWGFRHMHLGGPDIEQDGFVRRTEQVLFVQLQRDAAYLIDVLEHGSRHPTTFAEPHLLDIVHRRWPELIAHARCDDVSDLSPNDAEARWRLSRRRSGPRLSMGVAAADGTVYVQPGGGFMSSGRSGVAVYCAFELMNQITDLYERFSSQTEWDQPGSTNQLSPALKVRTLEFGVEFALIDEVSGDLLAPVSGVVLPDFARL